MQFRSTGPRDSLSRFHLFFFPISSAISFKGLNAHVHAPSPTGPHTDTAVLHCVQCSMYPKNAARGEEGGYGGGRREMDVRVCVYENRDEILVYTAELFMMPDRDAMPKRSPRSRIPDFRHQHSSLPSCVLFHSFPPFTPDFLVFSFRSLILSSCLLSRQLSCLYDRMTNVSMINSLHVAS